MTETEAKWAERVRQWRASGRTAEQFAQGQGFEPTTLRYWASRLAHPKVSLLAGGQGPASGTRLESSEPAGVRMVRVRRKRTSGETLASQSAEVPTMVIAIGAARVEVRPGFDPALLGEVVAALGGAR